MPESIEPAISPLEATFKARDVEGILDLYFYRPVAYQLALFFAALRATPNMVTILGGILGVIAGHLYFYPILWLNVIGMFLHVVANMLDNADGQLARLLNQKSRAGRVIDSLVDHFVFLSIYIHLALRCFFSGASPTIGLLALAAGLSHALQGAAADYNRNGYLYFVKGRARADWDSSETLLAEFRQLSWRVDPWNKFLLALYINFTRQQELLSPVFKHLRNVTASVFGDDVPGSLRQHYRDNVQPTLRWWGLLMTNTRMLFLFLFLFLGRPAWYFWLEITVFNLLLVVLISRQEKMSLSLVKDMELAIAAA
jgi:phosphatidylglycerophosphate synthase